MSSSGVWKERGAARRGVGPPASRSRCCPIDPPQHARRGACVDGWRVAGGKNGQQIQALKKRKGPSEVEVKVHVLWRAGKGVKADLTHDLHWRLNLQHKYILFFIWHLLFLFTDSIPASQLFTLWVLHRRDVQCVGLCYDGTREPTGSWNSAQSCTENNNFKHQSHFSKPLKGINIMYELKKKCCPELNQMVYSVLQIY